MKKFRKVLSVVLAMVMIISLVPMTVANAAEGAGELQLNTPVELCGDGTTYVFEFTPEKDGWYVFRSEGESDPYATLMNDEYEEIDYGDDFNEYQFAVVEKLYAGYTYILEVNSWDEDFEEFSVVVEETIGAESAEIIKEPHNTTVVEDFEYETLDASGLEVEFTMSDGSTVIWSYDERNPVGYEYVTEYEADDGQGHYYIDVICGDALARFFFTTVENKVESIEYKCDETISYYENTHGYDDVELGYYFYYYDIPNDAQVVLHYTDGTSETVDFYGDIYFEEYDIQDLEAWEVGKNYAYFSYLGKEGKIPVEILPCPIEKVTLNSLPTDEYCYGDSRFGYIDEYDGNYYLYPYDMSGISLTVEYKDGTTKTYTEEDFSEYGILDGYEYSVDSIVCDGLGTYQAALNYKGYSIPYEIKVIETPIAGIELSDAPDLYVYDSYFYPIFDGATIRLTFKDGTQKSIDITEENTYYECGFTDFEYMFTDGEYNVYANYSYNDEVGEYYTFSCMGFEYDYYGIEFEDQFYVDTIDFSDVTNEGFSAVVTDTDGVVREYNTDDLVGSFTTENYFEGYIKSEEGILYYSIIEEETGYYIWFMGKNIFIPLEEPADYILGDVNGDSDVAIVDATLVQRHVAKLDTLEGYAALAADVSKDGSIAIVDATFIQRFVAKIIDEF